MWVGTLNGLNRLKGGQITIYRKGAGLPDELIHSLFEDERGRIWVSTRGGIAYFESGRFTPVAGIPGGDLQRDAVARHRRTMVAEPRSSRIAR